MENEMQQISNRIKMRRLELKLSFQDLASLTDMNKSSLQRYETGSIKNIPLSKLKILSSALQTTPEWIMGLNEEKTATQGDDLLSSLFKQLSPENQDKVLEVARLFLGSQDNK